MPMTILSGAGNTHTKMIWTCDWNSKGILTAGLDRNIALWDVCSEKVLCFVCYQEMNEYGSNKQVKTSSS